MPQAKAGAASSSPQLRIVFEDLSKRGKNERRQRMIFIANAAQVVARGREAEWHEASIKSVKL